MLKLARLAPLVVRFIYLFIYKIRHQQNKDKIDNIKNTKAGAVHREELQLRDLKIAQIALQTVRSLVFIYHNPSAILFF